MPRFKSGIGPTGKNGKKKMPDAASSASVDEEKPRCHKKKPRPRVELDLERDERIALWLSSPAGLQATPHDDCDCELGLRTRKELHDLFCPFVLCFAFEIGCCAWDTMEWTRPALGKRRAETGYPMYACKCLAVEHAIARSRYPREIGKDCEGCEPPRKLGRLCWCSEHPRHTSAVWPGPGRFVGRGKIPGMPEA
jgi:hypothetical protein